MKAFLIFSVISSLSLINASSISSLSGQIGQVYRESGDRSHDDQTNKTRTMGGLSRSSNVRKPTSSLSNSSKVDLRNMNFSLPLLNSTIVLPKPISKRITTTTTPKTTLENKSKSSNLPVTELIAREQSFFYPIGNGISFFPSKPGYSKVLPPPPPPTTTTTTESTTTTTTESTTTTTTESTTTTTEAPDGYKNDLVRSNSFFYPIGGDGTSFFPYKPGYFKIPPPPTTTTTTTTTTESTTTTTEAPGGYKNDLVRSNSFFYPIGGDGTSFFPYKPGHFKIPPPPPTTTTTTTATTTTTDTTTTTTDTTTTTTDTTTTTTESTTTTTEAPGGYKNDLVRSNSFFYPIGGDGTSFFPYKPGHFKIPPPPPTTTTTTT
ncbi:hypothetical protein ACR3K2_22340, partial [Cryptosporidium serpentis]